MNIGPSSKTIKIVCDILQNYEQINERKLPKMLSILSSSVASDINLAYFGLNYVPKKITVQLIDRNESEAQPEKGLSLISKYNYLPKEYQIAQVIRAVVHESAHHSQFYFFKNLNRDLSNGYLESLKLNVLKNPYIYYNGEKHKDICNTYIPPSNKNIPDYLYAAQPKEAQAFNLTNKYCIAMASALPTEYLDIFKTILETEKENLPQEIDDLCRQNGIVAVHAQCSQMLLNLHNGTSFPVYKKVQDVYRELIQGQLKDDTIEFLGIKEKYPPEIKDLEDNLIELINQDENVDLKIAREKLSSTVSDFQSSILTINDFNRLQDQIIFGAQYKIGNKDYNEFLFSIGEKPFQELELDK